MCEESKIQFQLQVEIFQSHIIIEKLLMINTKIGKSNTKSIIETWTKRRKKQIGCDVMTLAALIDSWVYALKRNIGWWRKSNKQQSAITLPKKTRRRNVDGILSL